MADFLWKDVICRYKAFYQLAINNRPENKRYIEELTNRVGINQLRISAYNSKVNRGIEGNYNNIRNTLLKMEGLWVENLPVVLFVKKTLVKNNTGFTPYYLMSREEAILPLETTIPT